MRCFRHILIFGFVWAVLVEAVIAGQGQWPQFRGPKRDAISNESGLLRKWPAGGPKVRWSVEVCQGYSSAAIHGNRVYFNDYDEKKAEWLVRCLSLVDGKELWRYREAKTIRPNHGITRTVPAVDDRFVFSMDPKCVFHCIDARTGKQIWNKVLVQEYQTKIPPWYAGQCPLIEDDRVIIATGGKRLIVALDKATGKAVWEADNPEGWVMSHSSVMPAEIAGVRQYIYCVLKGLVGVSAADGQRLWYFPWKFNVVVTTSPLVIPDGRIFATSCYDADGAMIRVTRQGETFTAEKLFTLSVSEWNSEVHTPVLYKDHIFGVGKKKRGLFTCLDMNGKVVWTSEGKASFGLGSYLLADGMFYVLEGDTGMLRLIEADVVEYKELDHAQVLSGDNAWGPMALADGKLVLRDMTKMVCIEVGAQGAAKSAD